MNNFFSLLGKIKERYGTDEQEILEIPSAWSLVLGPKTLCLEDAVPGVFGRTGFFCTSSLQWCNFFLFEVLGEKNQHSINATEGVCHTVGDPGRGRGTWVTGQYCDEMLAYERRIMIRVQNSIILHHTQLPPSPREIHTTKKKIKNKFKSERLSQTAAAWTNGTGQENCPKLVK